MTRGKLICMITLVALTAITMAGCVVSTNYSSNTAQSLSASQQNRPEGWTEETHSSDAEPDYETVFPEEKVNQIKITIDPEDWGVMQANMNEIFAVRGVGQRGGQPVVPAFPPEREGMPPGNIPPEGGVAPRAPGIPGWIDMTAENPQWIPATIEFNGLIWTNVGVRYKGNSSLRSSWGSGSLKLPLKLDFDEFEDDYPQIENQRFYGFKQLSLSTSFSDSSYMRDVITADLLEEAGLVAAETAYYEVILDYGQGSINLGLYVMIEVIDDTVIKRFFGSDSGNIYEGEGPGVSLALGTFDQIQQSFLKENNPDEADWSDIETLYNVLHSTERTSHPTVWRENLESVFNVDAFLEWLALSAIIQHWDTYGQMPHNFYLYNDPDTGMLTWISWDHNMVLGAGDRGGTPGGMRFPAQGGMGQSTTLSREEISQNWPLIRYLLDDAVYQERYIDCVAQAVNGVYNPETLEKKCRDIADTIAPYVIKEFSETDFESAVDKLIDCIYRRHEEAANFVATKGGK